MPCSDDSKALSIVNLSQNHEQGLNCFAQKRTVLRNINMTIEPGQIYTLLGPSGCGKTTLIRCILGLSQPNQGSIKVFGCPPGRFQSLPSSGIGYMPQSSALYDYLTVSENLRLFSRFYHMKDPSEQINLLISTMDLPGNRLAMKLSGGQRRRLSLAITIIHEPPFIILDEPTVGIDPILQKQIWTYLVSVARSKNISILFTTHYIDEARIADVIGFLSEHGTFIVQDNVNTLLRRYGTMNLTILFHKVYEEYRAAHSKKEHQDTISSIDIDSTPEMLSLYNWDGDDSSGISDSSMDIVRTGRKRSSSTDSVPKPILPFIPVNGWFLSLFFKLWVLVAKDLRSLFRNPLYLAFQFILPTIEVVLFCVCIGGKLQNINLSVYNGDVSNLTLSFLNEIDPKILKVYEFSTEIEAMDAVRHGFASGALIMPENYTANLNDRFFSLGDIEPQLLLDSTLNLYPDMSNMLIIMAMYQEISDAFQSVGKKYLSSLGLNPSLMDLPVVVGEPIYGNAQSMFRDFMAPGVILSIIFLAAISLTAVNLVSECKLGQFQRCRVSGVPIEFLLLAQMISHAIVITIQCAFVLIVVFPLFQISFHGELFFIFLLCLAQSFCGMAFGLMVASMSSNETVATMLSLGFFYPSLLLSGTVWPIESMSPLIRTITDYMPQTQAIFSMRCMISRGWGPEQNDVMQGFIASFLWTFAFLLVGVLFFRRTVR